MHTLLIEEQGYIRSDNVVLEILSLSIVTVLAVPEGMLNGPNLDCSSLENHFASLSAALAASGWLSTCTRCPVLKLISA